MLSLSFANWFFSVFLLSFSVNFLFARKIELFALYSLSIFFFLGLNWLFFIFSYFHIEFNIYYVSLLSLCCLIYNIYNNCGYLYFDLFSRLCLTVVLLFPLYYSFGDVFTAWDAIASWNRWSVDIFNREYTFSGTAYPVLLSSIIALVYEFQNTSEIWYFAKFVLIFPSVFFILLLSVLFKNNKNLAVSLYLIFIHYTTYKSVNSGEADFAVVLVGLCVLLISYYSLKRNFFSTSLISVLVSGPLCLLKQPGVVFLIFAIIISFVILYNRDTVRRSQIAALFIVSVFSGSFLVGFNYLHTSAGNIINSNFDYLVGLSSAVNNWDKFNRFFLSPKPALDFILVPASLYLLSVKFKSLETVDRQFSVLAVLCFMVGCSLWFYAFSYDGRNALWAKIFVLFVLAIFFSRSSLAEQIAAAATRYLIRLSSIPCSFFMFGFLSLFIMFVFKTNDSVYGIQTAGQSKLGPVLVAEKIDELLSDSSGSCPYLVTNDLMLPHNFILKDYSMNIIANAWDVNGVLDASIPSCPTGGYYYFGHWSRNDPNWDKIYALVDDGVLSVSDLSLRIFFRPYE